MRVKFSKTDIEGPLVVETNIFRDERGFFTEVYAEDAWQEQGFTERFVQDNMSLSAAGTLRGMHYQKDPHALGKLVRVLRGAVFDVAVDLRRGSPTLGRWVGQTLTAENGLAFWVPPGFAHGFLATEPDTLVYYKCTGLYAPQAEASLSYKDPAVDIKWPSAPRIVAPRDEAAPLLADADYNFTYHP